MFIILNNQKQKQKKIIIINYYNKLKNNTPKAAKLIWKAHYLPLSKLRQLPFLIIIFTPQKQIFQILHPTFLPTVHKDFILMMILCNFPLKLYKNIYQLMHAMVKITLR